MLLAWTQRSSSCDPVIARWSRRKSSPTPRLAECGRADARAAQNVALRWQQACQSICQSRSPEQPSTRSDMSRRRGVAIHLRQRELREMRRHGATTPGIALSRWRHGFESRWGCERTPRSGPVFAPGLMCACLLGAEVAEKRHDGDLRRRWYADLLEEGPDLLHEPAVRLLRLPHLAHSDALSRGRRRPPRGSATYRRGLRFRVGRRLGEDPWRRRRTRIPPR